MCKVVLCLWHHQSLIFLSILYDQPHRSLCKRLEALLNISFHGKAKREDERQQEEDGSHVFWLKD